MADNVTIENIGIEVDYSAGNATKGIDSLKASLQSLNSAISPAVTKLSNLHKSVSGLSTVDFGKFSTQMSGIAGAVKPLTELGKSNLGNLVNQIKKIPDINKVLDSKMIEEFTNKIEQLNNALSPLANNLSKISTGFSSFPSKISKASGAVSTYAKGTQSLGKISNLLNFGAIYIGIQKATDLLTHFITESNNYQENLNLFTVAMGETAEEASNFTKNFSEALGVDPSGLMRYMGVFQMLNTGFGLTSKEAYKMSKNLTQLTYDVSAFYNINIDESAIKLQSALAGELEPVRRLGYALDQTTLQQLAYKLGIDKSLQSMNQAEKAQLRYVALLTQNKQVHGDMARTLNAPANALRILGQQFTLVTRAIGDLFIPILLQILPPAIAVLKVITLVTRALASFLGFKLTDIDYSSLENVSSGFDGIGSSAKKAAKDAKKAQNSIAKFDELNIIQKPSASGGSGDGGVGGAGAGLDIDLPEYNALTDAITTNIDEWVEKVKDFFGVMDNGKISFKEMDGWAKGILATLTALASLKLLKWIASFGPAVTLLKATWVAAITPLVTWWGKLTVGIANATYAAGGTVTKFGVITKALGSVALSIGAVVSIGTSIIALFQALKGLNQETGTSFDILGVHFEGVFDVFDKSVSKATKSVVEPFLDKVDSISAKVKGFEFTLIKQKDIDEIAKKSAEVTKTIKENAFDKLKEESDKIKASGLFADDPAKEAEYLERLKTNADNIVKQAEDTDNQIKEILDRALKTGQTLTEDDVRTIEALQQKKKENGVRVLSESEKDSIVILNKLKDKAQAIEVKQYGQMIANAKKNKDDTIKEAESKYSEQVSLLDDMFYVQGIMTEEEYNTQLKKAQEDRDNKIKTAEETYSGIQKEVETRYPEIAKTIDFENGKTKSNMQLFWTGLKEGWKGFWADVKSAFVTGWDKIKTWWNDTIAKWWKDNVSPWFTREKWKSLFNNIKQGFIDKWNEIKSWFSSFTLPKFKMEITYPDTTSILAKAAKLIGLKGVPNFKLKAYASGGLPNTGEFFMAREAGPELVGRIGNRSAVANNDQIVTAIEQGVYRATVNASVGNNSGQPIIIKIGEDTILKKIVGGISSENNRYGKPVVEV